MTRALMLNAAQIEAIAVQYPHKTNKELARSFGLADVTIKNYAERFGWVKSKSKPRVVKPRKIEDSPAVPDDAIRTKGGFMWRIGPKLIHRAGY